jgi:Ca-activated chloride channel family protein
VSFIWPPLLILLLLVPAGVWLVGLLDRRRRRQVAERGGSGLAVSAGRRQTGLRGRVPGALLLVGLSIMLVALARPQGTVDLPREEGTVILAFDVSGSMAADDLKPTRMDAAKAASQAFVEHQPSSVVVGVVAFSDAGLAVQTPTDDQATVLAAIDRLAPQKGTALGQGILASLNAIAVARNGPSTNYYSNRTPAPTPSPTPVPAGTHAPAVIVLLTDGENNESPDPLAAAQAAADQGVRIFTVGLGSPAGTTLDLNGFKVHTQLDESLLQQIARITDGAYYAAADQRDLASVYDQLDMQLVVRPETIELTSIFAGASIVFLALGGLSSLLWLGRLP